MLTVEQQNQLSDNLALLDQAAREGRKAKVVLYKGKPVVKISSRRSIIKHAWQIWNHQHISGARLLRNQVMSAVADPKTQLSLKQQIVDGVEGRRYTFLEKSDISTITAKKEWLLKPFQAPPPEPFQFRPLGERTTARHEGFTATGNFLPDAIHEDFHPHLIPPAGQTEHTLPDAIDENFHPQLAAIPYEAVSIEPEISLDPLDSEILLSDEEASRQEKEPGLTYTVPSITVTPPPNKPVDIDPARLMEFEAPLMPTPASFIATSEDSEHKEEGIPFKPVPYSPPEPIPSTTPYTVSGPLQVVEIEELPSVPGTFEPLLFPKPPLEMLEDSFHYLASHNPDISLADARGFLWNYHAACFLELEIPDHSESMKEWLYEHFQTTGLQHSYNKLNTEQMWRAVNAIKLDETPDVFERYLYEISEGDTPQRFKVTQHLVAHIMENGFRKEPSLSGGPFWKVDTAHLQFIKAVQEQDELMEQLGFDLIDEEESEKPIKANASQFDLEAAIKDDIEHLSTEVNSFRALVDQLEDIDPETVKSKLQGETSLSPEELSAIVASRKQLLEIEETLGRKWDQPTLLNPNFWANSNNEENGDDDGFSTYIKMFNLAHLTPPGLASAQHQWLVKQHDDKPHHPSVVIEGFGVDGLLTALTQFEAGANVTLLNTQSTADPSNVLRLDPIWMNTLQFYLGERFDHLFTYIIGADSINTPGILSAEGFGEISEAVLEEALREELLALAKPAGHSIVVVQDYVGIDEIKASLIPQPAGDTEPHAVMTPDDSRYHLFLNRDSSTHPRLTVPVDLLICSGKTPSKTCSAFLKPSVVKENDSVTPNKAIAKAPEKLTGSCSWEKSTAITTLHRLFDDEPIATLRVDDSFKSQLVSNLQTRLNPGAAELSEVNPQVRSAAKIQLVEHSGKEGDTVTLPRDLQALLDSVTGGIFKMEMAEDQKQIHLNMELPGALNRYLSGAATTLKFQDATDSEIDIFTSQILKAWFDTVAAHTKTGVQEITPDSFVPGSIGTQSYLKHELETQIERLETENSYLVITAVGETVAKAPLKSEAAMTAAREQILSSRDISAALIAGKKDQDFEEIIDDVENHYEHTANLISQSD